MIESPTQFILNRHSALNAERAIWDTFWQTLGNYFSPRKADITSIEFSPDSQRFDELYDISGISACEVAGNGQMWGITQPNDKWFRLSPPVPLRHIPAVVAWHAECTEILLEEFLDPAAQFYNQMHEVYLDRSCFGTAVLYGEEGDENNLWFKAFNVGTWSIAENPRGVVDCLFRENPMTLRQMVARFGLDDVAKAHRENFIKGITGEDPKALDRQVPIVHAVYPREDQARKAGSADVLDMAYRDAYVDKKESHMIRESGFPEFPYSVTRWAKWQGNKYGYSPAWKALPEIRQLSELQKNLDYLADLLVNPRILYPSNSALDVDLAPGGGTAFDENNPNAVPREWATVGDYRLGMERAQYRKDNINQAFHVDLFQLFANLDQKNMTATEVIERSAEKLNQFGPIFHRLTTELLDPVITRSFALLLRMGKMPPIPQEMIIVGPDGSPGIGSPRPVYMSKIALALDALESGGFMKLQELMLNFNEIRPEIWDNVDFDAVVRDSSYTFGLPNDWLVPVEVRDEGRRLRAEAQARAEALQEAEMAANAAGRVGRVPPENLDNLVNRLQSN